MTSVALPHAIDASLLERINAVPALAPHTDLSDLSGGLTNRNIKVTTPTGVVVARLSSPESALLAIDRGVEHANSVAAAASGAGPEVIAFAPEVSVLAVRFIDGRTWSDADVLAPENSPRIAAACHQLHAGPRFVNDFDMMRLQPHYLSIVRERGLRLPDRYDELEWADPPPAIPDLAAAYRRAMRSKPKDRVVVAARELGWLYSGWQPDASL